MSGFLDEAARYLFFTLYIIYSELIFPSGYPDFGGRRKDLLLFISSHED